MTLSYGGYLILAHIIVYLHIYPTILQIPGGQRLYHLYSYAPQYTCILVNEIMGGNFLSHLITYSRTHL